MPVQLHTPCTLVPPSQLAFSADGIVSTTEEVAPPAMMVSAAKARDQLPTNVLCGEERPSVDAPVVPAHMVPADAKAVAGMMISELRIALRARGLSPAGAHATLVERLLAGIAAGSPPVMLPDTERPGGCGSGVLSAAYARAAGGLPTPEEAAAHAASQPAPPAIDNNLGALLSDDAPPPPVVITPLSDAARAQLTSHVAMGEGGAEDDASAEAPHRKVDPRRVADMNGCDIFASPAPDTVPWSAGKAADYKGSGIFDQGVQPGRLPGVTARPLPAKRAELGSALVFDGETLVAPGELPAPALGLSTAKSSELGGGDVSVLAVGAEALPEPARMNALKAAELDSTVFAEPEEVRVARDPAAGLSPAAAAGRARDYGSTLFKEEFVGPQPRKEPSATVAKHAADLHSKGSAEGCTMAFAAPTPKEEPAPPVAARNRRVSGGGPSSVVFG